jgi:hypothetical protein
MDVCSVEGLRGVEANPQSGSNGRRTGKFPKSCTPGGAFDVSTFGLNPSPNVLATMSLQENSAVLVKIFCSVTVKGLAASNDSTEHSFTNWPSPPHARTHTHTHTNILWLSHGRTDKLLMVLVSTVILGSESRGNVLTSPLHSNGCVYSLNYSGFQQSCHNIIKMRFTEIRWICVGFEIVFRAVNIQIKIV